MTRLPLAFALLAAPALADQTEGRPWEICIPVDTAMAAAWEAAHPSTVYPLQRRAYAPLRDTGGAWRGAREHASQGWIESRRTITTTETHAPPPIPLPATIWMLLAGVAGLMGWRMTR